MGKPPRASTKVTVARKNLPIKGRNLDVQSGFIFTGNSCMVGHLLVGLNIFHIGPKTQNAAALHSS